MTAAAVLASAPDKDDEKNTRGLNSGLVFEVRKPVNLAQLEHEIVKAHGWRKAPGLSAEGDPAEATEQAPVTLWVHREDADAKTVIKAITDHDRNESWAAPDDEG